MSDYPSFALYARVIVTNPLPEKTDYLGHSGDVSQELTWRGAPGYLLRLAAPNEGRLLHVHALEIELTSEFHDRVRAGGLLAKAAAPCPTPAAIIPRRIDTLVCVEEVGTPVPHLGPPASEPLDRWAQLRAVQEQHPPLVVEAERVLQQEETPPQAPAPSPVLPTVAREPKRQYNVNEAGRVTQIVPGTPIRRGPGRPRNPSPTLPAPVPKPRPRVPAESSPGPIMRALDVKERVAQVPVEIITPATERPTRKALAKVGRNGKAKPQAGDTVMALRGTSHPSAKLTDCLEEGEIVEVVEVVSDSVHVRSKEDFARGMATGGGWWLPIKYVDLVD